MEQIYPTFTDWDSRWNGGFCPLAAVGALPVRGPDYCTAAPLADRLLEFPSQPVARVCPTRFYSAWSKWLGDVPVAFARSVSLARELMMRAAGVEHGQGVGLAANATDSLVQDVKRIGAHAVFCELDANLEFDQRSSEGMDARVTWTQPIGGLWNPHPLAQGVTLVDFSDTLPLCHAGQAGLWHAAIWGLHLDADPQNSGALVAFNDDSLYHAFNQPVSDCELPNLERAWAQYERLEQLAGLQEVVLMETRRGLEETAGLPLMPRNSASLAHGIAVKIPPESDPSTFYAHVRAENTLVRRLPELRPVHYAAIRQCSLQTARHLARWLFVPVGPDFTAEEIKHAVLGIVKVSDYLGMRWYTDPVRAGIYAQEMRERYGDDHDAYRPLFSIRVTKDRS